MGGPAVDYTHAPHAYALNATLLHDPARTPEDIRLHGPGESAEILLVERASGHGVIGSFGGVSGYVDTLKSPVGDDDDLFDPIAHTLREEFEEECGFTDPSFELVDFHVGAATTEMRTRTPGAKISVVPILGLCVEKPEVTVNVTELASYRWVGFKALQHVEKMSRGYMDITLPAALGAIGLTGEALNRLLK